MMDYYSTACYKDILQIDGAFAEAHLFYHKTPVFDGVNATSIVEGLDENRIINEIDSKSTRNNFDRFRGTFEEYNVSERLELWKSYFKEYANAFNKLIYLLPKSVVTVFVARQTVEIGMKYLLLCKNEKISKTHDLKQLVTELFNSYEIQNNEQYTYMEWVDAFLINYSIYIENEFPEYFRYPEYNKKCFGGICYDIEWLIYNLEFPDIISIY